MYESGRIFYKVFTLFQVVNYIFLYVTSSRSCLANALERCPGWKTIILAQTGSKNEQFVDDSQRKSKKTEKSDRRPMDENVSVWPASFKEEQGEVSFVVKISRSSRSKHSRLQSPRPGPSC